MKFAVTQMSAHYARGTETVVDQHALSELVILKQADFSNDDLRSENFTVVYDGVSCFQCYLVMV